MTLNETSLSSYSVRSESFSWTDVAMGELPTKKLCLFAIRKMIINI